MTQLKLRKTGNSLSTSWPKELLSRRNVKEGDRLFVIETRHGVMVTPQIPSSSAPCRTRDEVIERFKRAYKVLADR
jgi:antitoxin MazE